MLVRSTQIAQASAPVSLGTGEVSLRLILTPAAAAAVATIKEGGPGGTTVLTLQAAANGESVQFGPLSIRDPYLSSIVGAGAFLHVLK